MKLTGFGMNFSVMPPDIGENHVILCRLILGKCEKVQAGSQQLYPSSPEFDTGVDDVSNPKWYIVWGANMNTHILPECIVSYKHNIDVLGNYICANGAAWLDYVSNCDIFGLVLYHVNVFFCQANCPQHPGWANHLQNRT